MTPRSAALVEPVTGFAQALRLSRVRRVSGRPRRRWAAAVAAVALAGGLAAGCGGTAQPQGSGGVLTNSATTTTPTTRPTTKPTTTSTLAPCGAQRDPFDPTASPPPSGSPAIC